MTRGTPSTARALLLAALLFFASAGDALADKVRLVDGREFEGKILRDDAEGVKIMTARAAFTFKRAEIAEIVRGKSSVEEFEERLTALTPAEPRKYLEAGIWCLDTLKREDLGLRLLQLAMVYSPECFVQGQLYLGKYYQAKRNVQLAAQAFLRARLADPKNQEAEKGFNAVKDEFRKVGRQSDESLLAGLQAAQGARHEQAREALANGMASMLLKRAEELLGVPVRDVIGYCSSQIICKVCGGSRQVQCSICKGQAAMTCVPCGGSGVVTRKNFQKVTNAYCSSCGGYGDLLCDKCDAKRIELPSSPPTTTGFLSRKLSRVEGGKLTCRMCKPPDKNAVVTPPPAIGLGNAIEYMERHVKGQLTLTEQGESRLQRVGGMGQVEGADELRATPVWLNGKWVSLNERRAADSGFNYQPEGLSEDHATLRKGALPFQIEGAEPEAFLERIRKTFGLEGNASVGSPQVFFTDFVTRQPEGDLVGAGPFVEVDDLGGRLLPCLVQAAQPYMTTRITLDSPDGRGLVPAGKSGASGLGSIGTNTVRVYYSVVDANEDVSPSGNRDVTSLRLIVKLVLVDVLDPAGGPPIFSLR
ncbi:MAG: hypothetical protein HYZ53_18460 [Planctomycetes bacterium]|nr:hypothetical protein [Planctomycetota bacterium]